MAFQTVTFQKIPVFDRSGDISAPFVTKIQGMDWKTEIYSDTSASGTTYLNIRYKCEDFHGQNGCLVFLNVNRRLSSHFFRMNNSIHNIRYVFCGVELEAEDAEDWQQPPRQFPKLKFVESPKQPVLDDFHKYHPVILMTTTHLPLSASHPVSRIYMHQPTGPSHLGELPFEFHPTFHTMLNGDVGRIVGGFKNKSELELREIQAVLGYYYHEVPNGFIDDNLVKLELISHQYGFKKSVSTSEMFSWKYRTLRIVETVVPPYGINFPEWEFSSTKFVRTRRDVAMYSEIGSEYQGQRFTLIVTVFKSTYNSKQYLSFGVLMVTPFMEDKYWCKIDLSSPIGKINICVQRCLKLGQNTMVVPTLCEYSDKMEKLFALKMEITLKKIQLEAVPRRIVFPGICDFQIKSGLKFMTVNKDILIEHLGFFNRCLGSAHFGPDKADVKVTGDEWVGLYHVMDALYHGSKTLSVESFFQFGAAVDMFHNEELFNAWERCGVMSKVPAIRKAVHDQYKANN
ncbi:unnamed protein product [Caenorhabditis brenneri]